MWEGGMDQHGIEEPEELATFGRRKVAPRVCVADFLAVREMGFDLVQGFVFAKPMPAKKFARTMLGRHVKMP
jgi:hypothetical protein